MMRAARDDRRLVGLPALALALATGSLPAAAQSGSEAVVCVGSETRTLATNPIRRVHTEDIEIVYRTGVDIGKRDQVERTLSSGLGSSPEVWCAWSDPGADHAVIISYTGVIRQDLTVDREDPRFQAFSVGFGTDFDAAETQATTINQRCYLWNPGPRESAAVNWSGECSGGLADGRGEETWHWNDGSVTGTGMFQDVRREGFHVIIWGRAGDDNVVREEGSFVNDEPNGTWTGYDASGNVVGMIRFGRRVSGSGSAVEAECRPDRDVAADRVPNGLVASKACTVTPRSEAVVCVGFGTSFAEAEPRCLDRIRSNRQRIGDNTVRERRRLSGLDARLSRSIPPTR